MLGTKTTRTVKWRALRPPLFVIHKVAARSGKLWLFLFARKFASLPLPGTWFRAIALCIFSWGRFYVSRGIIEFELR